MRKDKAPLVIMALIMAALGLLLVMLFGSTLPPVPPPTPTSEQVPSQASPTEVALLLVGVDSLSYPDPTLKAAAIVKYDIGVGMYTLISVSPDTVVNPDSSDPAQRTLGGVYDTLDAPNGRGAMFTKDALEHIMPGIGSLDPEVDFDGRTQTETISELGNFEFGGEKLDGAALLNRFEALPPGAKQKRLEFQEEVLRCLFLAAQRQKNWDLRQLMSALGGRFYPGTALDQLKTAPPLADSEFTVTDVPLTPPIMPTP
jgi:hypothetical protein